MEALKKHFRNHSSLIEVAFYMIVIPENSATCVHLEDEFAKFGDHISSLWEEFLISISYGSTCTCNLNHGFKIENYSTILVEKKKATQFKLLQFCYSVTPFRFHCLWNVKQWYSANCEECYFCFVNANFSKYMKWLKIMELLNEI